MGCVTRQVIVMRTDRKNGAEGGPGVRRQTCVWRWLNARILICKKFASIPYNNTHMFCAGTASSCWSTLRAASGSRRPETQVRSFVCDY